MATPKFAAPFQAWAVDYLPTLPETSDGYKHIQILVDPFFRWTELVPMKTKSFPEVAEAIKLYVIARFGVPKDLRFDGGREYAGDIKALCEKLNIAYKAISTKHP